MNRFSRFLQDEHGLETVEYAIIAGLIVVALIALMTAIGTKVKNKFQTLHNAM